MDHLVRRTAVAALAAVVLLLIVPVAASGQTDPYPPGTAAACPASTVQPGDTITCSVEGFAADSEVEVAVQGVGWSRTYTVTADGDGVARVDITVPSDAAPGSMTVTFTGRDAAGDFLRVAVAALTVTGPGDHRRPDRPRTGRRCGGHTARRRCDRARAASAKRPQARGLRTRRPRASDWG